MLTNNQIIEALTPITPEEHEAFKCLEEAFLEGIAGLMVCVEKTTGKRVVSVCAFIPEEDGTENVLPLARLFDDNPIETLVDPRCNAGLEN